MPENETFSSEEQEKFRAEANDERVSLGLGVAYDPEEADSMGAFADPALDELFKRGEL